MSNVYLVDGAQNAAIYDLNNGELFQISKTAKELVYRILQDDETHVSQNEKEYINQLVELNLLTYKYIKPHEISELKKNVSVEFVWIEITNMCNLKCVHCYDEALCGNGKIMQLKQFKHIVDELVEYGVKKIQIIGGEPFILGKKLQIYLNYCIGKFDYIEIFTNGTLINDEDLVYIKKNNIKIALSVYSYIEEQHNKVTKNNLSWKKTNLTIKKLQEQDIEYRVKNVLMKDLEIGEKNTSLYELSHRKDIVRLTGRANLNLISDELIRKKLITENNIIYKLKKNVVEKNISGHNCFSRRLYFSVDLNVYPCVMERRFCHGTISNNHLKDIIKDDIRFLTKDKINECCSCEFRYCCFDCRPDSNGKDKLEKPWYCTYLPLEGKWDRDIEGFIKRLKE